MITIEKKLASEIMDAVEKIVTASHAAASEALDQAFGRGQARPSRRLSHPVGRTTTNSSMTTVRRRPEELLALTEQLYASICAQPGASMAVLAEEIGSKPRALHRPASRLIAEGRIKAIGERQSTRYFPLGATPAAAKAQAGQ